MKSTTLQSTALVAISSGLVAAAYALFHGVGFGLLEEEAGVVLMLVPYAAVLVGLVFAALAFAARRLHPSRSDWLRDGSWLVATLLVVGTLVLFGPIGGFHHMFRLGVLGYAVLDCESPGRGAIPLGSCGVRGSPILLAASIAIWGVFVLVTTRLLARRRSDMPRA